MSVQRPVFLIGFMGAGKSTVGRIVAELLERPFCDLDREIENAEGRSVDHLFRALGEEGFRDAERTALRRVASHKDAVVACGGGIVTDEGSRAILRASGEVIHLAVSAGEAIARLENERAGRPLLRQEDAAGTARLLASREGLYRSVADFTIPTDGHAPEDIAGRIVLWVETAP